MNPFKQSSEVFILWAGREISLGQLFIGGFSWKFTSSGVREQGGS